jgi:predicted XRE-type DNA-binding protein
MKKDKKNRLESAGWQVGSTKDFLGLTPEEEAFLEMKLTLAMNLKKHRRRKKLTQAQLAYILKSSQSRVAKMEAGDPSVSIDLLVKSLLLLGTSPKEIGHIIRNISTRNH